MVNPVMLSSLTVESAILAAMEVFLPIVATNPPDTIANIQKAIQATEAKTNLLVLSETDAGTLTAMRAFRHALELHLSKALPALQPIRARHMARSF